MLRLPKFEYIAPRTVEEAARILSRSGKGAMLVAGGTDAYPKMLRRQREPDLVVSTRRITSLKGIKGNEAEGVTIGSGTTLAEISAHPIIQKHYPALSIAASMVASPQIRNSGTIGGNLLQETRCTFYDESYWWRESAGACLKVGGSICHVAAGGERCWAVSTSDLAPVTVALSAKLSLVGDGTKRVIDADRLYADDGVEYLTKPPGEILTAVFLPPADGLVSAYLKLRRRGAIDFPMLGVAAAARFDATGAFKRPRVVLGGVASFPLEAREAETILEGREPTADLTDQAASVAYDAARPMNNSDLTLLYRKSMVREYVRRALSELARYPRPPAR